MSSCLASNGVQLMQLTEDNLRRHVETVGWTAMLSAAKYDWADEDYWRTECSVQSSTTKANSFVFELPADQHAKRKGSARKKREQLKRKGVRLGVTEMYEGVV